MWPIGRGIITTTCSAAFYRDPTWLPYKHSKDWSFKDEMGIVLSGVYGALAYYYLNQEEIEADIQANSEEAAMKPLNRD